MGRWKGWEYTRMWYMGIYCKIKVGVFVDPDYLSTLILLQVQDIHPPSAVQ